MTKKLNIGGITNELEESAFFHAKKPSSPLPVVTEEKKSQPEKTDGKQTNVQGVPPPVRGTVPRTTSLIPKTKRPIKQRQPFDIYEDQYEALKKIADAERGFVNGRGMSQMVREAIDNYLKDQNTTQE
jgi:hypothetical protein